ncbi:dTDP-glucose 4,6-dehydratase [Christiangramia portivictoriae]|uniref:dTDP-glucose 4,6-dehydratase n=1 Tax=Christiangramia portivictoriae TaxID=326069 RepID=UPI00041B08CC|nr:dTDP-glucose 4,6-dehydratase [Christiangramia portivictoriae]
MNDLEQKVLVTGGAGFIGSNFIAYYLEEYPEVEIINLDALTYAGNLENLSEVEANPRYTFIKGDIRNRELLEKIFQEYHIIGVIHFAAESHVDNSINNPGVFIETNVNGTFNLLDVAFKTWMKGPFEYKEEYENSRFHHISTDEVYGSLGETGHFTEETPYAPNSPYSASKAASDMVVRSYHHTYGMNTVITNCSNNYGPKQHAEKLIPTIVSKALSGEEIPIYGNGKNVRDWLFVLDHVKAISLVYAEGKAGEVYNIGGDQEMRNIDIAHKICSLLDELQPKASGSYSDQITFVKDRAGHDLRYAIDASKIKSQLNWKATSGFEEALRITLDWYFGS